MSDYVFRDDGQIVKDDRMFAYLEMEGATIETLKCGQIVTPDHPLFEALKRAGLVVPVSDQ